MGTPAGTRSNSRLWGTALVSSNCRRMHVGPLRTLRLSKKQGQQTDMSNCKQRCPRRMRFSSQHIGTEWSRGTGTDRAQQHRIGRGRGPGSRCIPCHIGSGLRRRKMNSRSGGAGTVGRGRTQLSCCRRSPSTAPVTQGRTRKGPRTARTARLLGRGRRWVGRHRRSSPTRCGIWEGGRKTRFLPTPGSRA
jgi:hypothetical protein